MTRRENSGERSLEFSRWIREELPDSMTGYMVGNQDWMFWNWKTRQLMLAEEKTHFAEIAPWMKNLIKMVIHPALKRYCKHIGVDYRGYHLIQFEKTDPETGRILFDRIEITKEELKQILSFDVYPPFHNGDASD